ncbi:MAG: ATP-binding cassette domain-containing protein [Ahrensia sp.]|nr:ATP-binding cassette domain-containing protein [Ahrensia sp.]
MSALIYDGVRIALNGRTLLDIQANVEAGQTLTIMGPSGSGKSSLLAYTGGFLGPAFEASGAILLNGQDVTQLPAYRRHTGILFQDPLLFPHMSVGGNLIFAVPQSIRGAERDERVAQALAHAELPDFADRDPATLSGGQKARVALMRVLLAEPKALLLDEPFSKLDSGLRDQVRSFVFAEAKRQNLPTVLVTHDEADAEAAGGQVIALG